MSRPAEASRDGRGLPLPIRFFMLVGGFMVTLAMGAVAPVLAKIDVALAHGATEQLLVKMLVPIAGAGMVVGAPAAGFLVDRVGLRPVLLVNGILFALAGTAGLYVGDIYTLVASRLVVGLSAAGLATTSMALINTRLDGIARARWMGFHVSTAMLGGLVAYPLIGALGEIGWRWPFAVYLFGLIVALVAFVGLEPAPPAAAPAPAGVGIDPADRPGGNPLRWFPLPFLLLALAVGSVTYLPTVYLAFVARGVGVTSPATLSALMLADALIGSGMSLIFGWSRRHISSNAAFVVSFSAAGIGMLIVSLATSIGGIVLGMLVYGFGIGWFMPNVMTALARRVRQDRQGRAVGILKSAHHLASPAAVLAVEPIARAFGPTGATMASAATCFVVAACFLVLSRRGAASATRPAYRVTAGLPETAALP